MPTDPHESAAEVEQRWVDTVRAVCLAVSIPVAVKLGPWLSSPAHHAGEIAKAGAKGLVLFNRFYQPDIDLQTLTPKPSLELSNPYEIRQALLWISLLSGRIGTSLAATGGVETGDEVVKYLLAGADVVMTASALLRHGPGHIGALRRALEDLDGRPRLRRHRPGARAARRRLPAQSRRPGARPVHQHPDRLPRRAHRPRDGYPPCGDLGMQARPSGLFRGRPDRIRR